VILSMGYLKTLFQYHSIGWHDELEIVSKKAVVDEFRCYSAISLGGMRTNSKQMCPYRTVPARIRTRHLLNPYLERYTEPNLLGVSPVEQKLKLLLFTMLPPANDKEMVKMECICISKGNVNTGSGLVS
jgi:hypothetical protein